jgi:hypothetical protein
MALEGLADEPLKGFGLDVGDHENWWRAAGDGRKACQANAAAHGRIACDKGTAWRRAMQTQEGTGRRGSNERQDTVSRWPDPETPSALFALLCRRCMSPGPLSDPPFAGAEGNVLVAVRKGVGRATSLRDRWSM